MSAFKKSQIGMKCKAHGVQSPRQYVVLRRGSESRVTQQIAQAGCFVEMRA